LLDKEKKVAMRSGDLGGVFGVLACVLLLGEADASAAEPYDANTMRPYVANDVNALIANRLFLQSMLAIDATPFTFGVGVRGTPASYRTLGGAVVDGGLSRQQYVLSVGRGRPTTGFAIFGGANLSRVLPTQFPNVTANLQNSEGRSPLRAAGGSLVLFAGAAYQGIAVELGYFVSGFTIDSDVSGRLASCPDLSGCGGMTQRPGSPFPSGPTTENINRTSYLLNLETAKGYSLGILFGGVDELTATGERIVKDRLAALRALAQPYDLVSRDIGLLGAGLNVLAPEVDYYGDRVPDLRKAAERGVPPPVEDGGNIVEFPIVGDHLANTGALARLIVQAAPSPLFRLLEVGYAYEGDPSGKLVPQAGVRAKLFRRADAHVPSWDAYAGGLWVLRKGEPDAEGRGLSAYVSYSYNSPDSLTFLPIPDAHVVGLQLVYGNPIALPPPVPNLKYPTRALGSSPQRSTTEAVR
jgi:hypothetical protein